MPIVPLPPPIAEILGSPYVAAVDESSLSRLVGVREGDHLEVKSQKYGNGDSDRRELAADVAAFANASGGLLLIGADEEAEQISQLRSLDLEGEELRVRQVLAGCVAPPVDIETKEIEAVSSPGSGYLLVVVPPSGRLPHAVVKNDDLRYPRRDGARKRWMAESEVADLYYRRFLEGAGRLARLEAVGQSIDELVDLEADGAWLVLTATPEIEGAGRSSRSELQAIEEWIVSTVASTPIPQSFMGITRDVTSGYRRYIAGDNSLKETGRARWAVTELHHDGSGAVAALISDRRRRPPDPDDLSDEAVMITDEALTFAAIGGLTLLARHARRRGASGPLHVAASFVSRTAMELGHARQHGFAMRLGDRASTGVEKTTHTFEPAELEAPGRGLLAATYLLTTDLAAGLGYPEILQLTIEGDLEWSQIGHDYRQAIQAWAEKFSVPVRGRS